MAFQTANVTPFGNQTNESWQKDAWINLYLPTKNGSRRKLGAIGLRTSKKAEADLIAFLSEDPEANTAYLLSRLQIEFNPSEASEDTGFALG